MDRRIFGIETEYGVTCTFRGQRRLSPDEVARYLFRRVVSWGRSSNVFLRNGARLYLDVGSHPEYATPECDNLIDLVTHDKAGERILEGLLVDADRRGPDPITERVLALWELTLRAVQSGDLGLVAREIDWVTKYQLIERYRAKYDLQLSHPRVAQLDLAYHDVHRGRGLYYLLQRRGAVERACRDLDIFEAKSVPPQTTRARLRGEFIKRAQERRRDFTVDWVHLKLNDQAQRTVLCKDPFRSVDERVERLIQSM